MENTCKPPSYEIATQHDLSQFILPLMNADELEDFVTFLLHCGLTTRQYELAGDSFRRNTYRSFVASQKKS